MLEKDWLATDEGRCIPCDTDEQANWIDRPYRLYRFLTDVEDIVDRESDDRIRLQRICPLVRRLLNSCEWLQLNFLPPDPETGWSVQMLYDEPDFPLTIQTVVWSPGTASPVHNHATWGIVALLDGQEKNTFWQRSPNTEFPDRIKASGDRILTPGDILCFTPDAIHQIEAIGDEPTISFNLYGATDYDRRFEFVGGAFPLGNPLRATAEIF
ncbi:cupin [Chamaesiphon sp. OTE_75_metabat_556]|uniref:cysteine dioxygenase family protein n=1 Tax=Chamaesiphon sp. OTE_75_metabat_556 TaxID=2964692 RepID=UPI00286A7FE9|nr:cupin [Chamaesiphon sp. OTE_75_metabat_556]